MKKNVPNILTMFRFILIPFIFISILNRNYISAFIFLTISGITDVLDGFIARKFNCITTFGKLIDPLADKATQISTLIALSCINIIPFWVLIIVFIKETIMVSGASFLYGKKLVVASRWYGKLSTTIFYIAIVSTFVVNYFNISLHFDLYLYYVALAATIFALVMYFKEFYQKGYVNKAALSTNDKKVISKNS